MEASNIKNLISQYKQQIHTIEQLIPKVRQRSDLHCQKQIASLEEIKQDLWYAVGIMSKHLR